MKATEPDYDRIAKEFGVTSKEVEDIYKSVFYMIRREMRSRDMRGIKSEDELDKMRTCFLIPCVGRLYSRYFRVGFLNDRHERYRNKEDKANVHETPPDEG